MVAPIKPGTSTELEVWSDRKARKVTVKVGERDESAKAPVAASGRNGGERSSGADTGDVLGITVRPLTPQERQKADTDGWLVAEQVSGAARKSGIEPGDIVLSVGTTSVKSFAELQAARRQMDARIERFFADLPADFESRGVRYVNNSGFDTEDPWSVILPHFFNHQTHHRAQVHTLLSQLGYKPPVLDLHRVLRPNPA
jgi:hypothetical protein